MTIKLRGRLFWGFCVISTSSLVLAGSALWISGFGNLERLRGAGFGSPNPLIFYTVLVTAGSSGLFAAILTGMVALRSGKTVSVEIFFFALWAFCQSFELAKAGSLVLGMHGASSVAFEIVTRAALFGRYTGTIALFSGSLFSVGLKQERGMPVLTTTLMAGLLFASIQPLNSVFPGVNFLADRGMESLAGVFEIAVTVMAVANYTIAWRSGKDRDYLNAGFGLVACVAASSMMRSSASPWITAVAIPVLAGGTWLHLKSLHDYYLWR